MSHWQYELERLADSVDGLPYLAIVSLEPDRGTIVAAYPSQLVGKTVDEVDVPGPATSTTMQKFIRGQLFKQVVFPAELDRGDYRLTSMDEKPLQGDSVLSPEQASEWIMWAHYVPHGQLAPWEPVNGIASGFVPVFFVAYWASVVAWVYQDAGRRGAAKLAWGFLVLISNAVGLVVYLIVRRAKRKEPFPGIGAE